MVHFLAYKKINDANRIADLFFLEIVCLHEMPKFIMLDRDSKFLLHFWQQLWKKLSTTLNFITTFHPQNDRQTKVVDRPLGTLLRILANDEPRSSDECLPHVEFAFNSSINRTTEKTPFMIVFGCMPQNVVDLINWMRESKGVENFVEKLKSIHEIVKENINVANDKYKEIVDSLRREKMFNVGDLVMVNHRKG